MLEEVIRMVLEIINSTLTHMLHHNPNLIYTLLYNKDMFISHFRIHPTFQDIIQNIDTVSTFRSYLNFHHLRSVQADLADKKVNGEMN